MAQLRYLATLTDPNLAPGDIRTEADVWVFDTLAELRDTFDQLRSGRWVNIPRTDISGRTVNDGAMVCDSPAFTVYAILRASHVHTAWTAIARSFDPYPSFIMECGPRGGIVTNHV